MREHHARAVEKAKARLLAEIPELLAIIVGGSIAKGLEREDSDVDLIIVIPDELYRQRLRENRVSILWKDFCDYEGGYIDGRLVSLSFIREAAERGSEPTRHSFTGAILAHCISPELDELIRRIPLYPEATHRVRIEAFLAQFRLNRGFFWNEGKRRGDRYLQTRAATEMVLFGCRLILAHNRQLFACQKRLVEQALAVPRRPECLREKIDRLLTEMTDEAKEDFCQTIEQFADWGTTDVVSRFLQDVEMSWFNHTHDVAEW